MVSKLLPVVLGMLHTLAALPTLTLEDLEMVDDTMSVGSYVREVRSVAPDDWHKSYEDEGDGEIGYSRKKSGGGKKGYQHFDSYHKKAGDNYEFEKADAFGLEDMDEKAAHSHPHEQRELHPRRSERLKRKPTESLNKRNHPDDEVERLSDDFKEIDHSELREGASDGNGGVESFGHDPNDYVLPEKYIYGSEEEQDEKKHKDEEEH